MSGDDVKLNATAVEREDKYRLRVGTTVVIAGRETEDRIRSLDPAARARFETIMGGRS